MALITRGALRRFFVGFAISGVILGLSIWIAPRLLRKGVRDRIMIPIDDRFGPRSPGSFVTNLELTRSPFVSRESHMALGLLELTISTAVGILVLIPSPYSIYRNLSKNT
jgi:hypothetical protein